MTQLLTLDRSGGFAVDWITERLQKAGLQVSPSFNLRTALAADTSCTCSHYADQCDYDMAVLLIYGIEPQPATLITHSHNGRTWLTLVDDGEERPLPELITQIKSALAAPDTKKKTAATR